MKTEKKPCATAWEQLCSVVENVVGSPTGGLQRETAFEDLGADSLDVAEIIIDAEHEFATLIPDEDAKEWKTLGDAMTWLEEYADLGRWGKMSGSR